MSGEPRPFDVCGPLPEPGVTVLEASAGTGKTFTIAALAARYVADGVPLDQLLLVTFTRMATGELRERVRERLVSAEQGLERALSGAGPDERDGVVRLLAHGTRAEVTARRQRLARALAAFDGATIATTHGFCQEVLGGLGMASDIDPGTTLLEDIDDLVEEVVDDLFVRRFHHADVPEFARAQALEIARLAVKNPTAPLEPQAAPAHTLEAMRVRLAEAVRRELDVRKRRTGVMTYDDLLTRLDAALSGDGGAAAAARLRERYRVVLVDEFQDTDPVQWDILRRAFGDGGVTLVLIGDPKQAIYAFRGADVFAYLDAARAASRRATLVINWRSDQALIDAYDALFAGARLGHPGIVYRTVRAADANRTSRLSGAHADAALRVRVVHRDSPSIELTYTGLAETDSTRRHVAADLAGDVVRLLDSGGAIENRAEDGTVLGRERVRPGHVAVLVRSHRSAAQIRDALALVHVPAVISGAGSVFGSPSAQDWLRLLEAVERPTHAPRARSAALTPFLGWSAERVAGAGEEEWEELHRRLHAWARLLRINGVASLTETLTLAEGLPGRLLAGTEGERRLTDLRHVAQLLHAAAAAEHMGTAALTAWLRQRIEAAERETGDEERSRRLESDAEAVQVLTIHRSKGLEFPIVYLPFAWEPTWVRREEVPVDYHDPDAGDRRTLDVGLAGPHWSRHKEQHLLEQRAEDLRLAYVALTRARHQAVVWWAGTWGSGNSALGRLLFARAPDGTVKGDVRGTPADAAAVARFDELAAAAPGCVSVERSALRPLTVWSPPLPAPAELTAAGFARELDRRWRRTSYSDITSGAHDARVASEPEEDVLADEPAAAAEDEVSAGGGGAPPARTGGDEPRLPLGDLPAGVRVGTFVHHVLEAADFAAADLEAELAGAMRAESARRPLDLGDPAAVVAGLRTALETPLGPAAGDLRLRDVAPADRLDELAFELPLAGGDDPSGRVPLAALAATLRRHAAPDDPLRGYAERLADPALRPDVRGYLAGSLDLVVRLPAEAGGHPRFAVVDYKTNWLAPPGEPLRAWHYRPEALVEEMERRHYPLQALLYAVALHRYLRWRLPAYDPDRDLAGVFYLFLRGMTGSPGSGVVAWRPAAVLVEALSDVLDRGSEP